MKLETDHFQVTIVVLWGLGCGYFLTGILFLAWPPPILQIGYPIPLAETFALMCGMMGMSSILAAFFGIPFFERIGTFLENQPRKEKVR